MPTSETKKQLDWRVFIAVLFFIGALAGGIWFVLRTPAPVAPAPTTQSPSNGVFVQAVSSEGVLPKESLTIGQRQALEKTLNDSVTEAKKNGTATVVGLWFRDLNNGPVIGINGDVKFSPASLLKLPLAIWFYREASTSPDVLTQEINFTGPKGTSIEHFPGNNAIEVGKVYSIEDLIVLMLEESDNDATAVLGGIAGIKNTDSVYKDLGVEPVSDYQTYTIDVKTYAAFLRILYTFSYIGKEYSNHVLELLTHSSFAAGLVAGVPSGIPVAHKFGERVIDAQNHLYQLHDCGIVYIPGKPYILCVMTQGHDYDELAKLIARLSRETYTAVSESN